MPCPINDATTAMKVAPEQTEKALKRIEELLYRNVSPKKVRNRQAFRLQQGFLLSSTQQKVDRLMVQVQEIFNNSKQVSDTSSILEETNQVKGYLCDANNVKKLLKYLYGVVLEQEEVGNPVEMKLQDFVKELSVTMETYLKDSSACMMKCVIDQCPHIMADEKVRSYLETLCREKGCLPLDFIHHCLLEHTAADILNKLSEINLSIVAHLSDRILDEVIETLSHTHKFLATPKLSIKRKSVNARKVRPQSVVEKFPSLSTSSEKLEHLGKTWPKRPKSRAPTRSKVKPLETHEDIHNFSEGLEVFFCHHPNTMSMPTLSPDSDDLRSRTYNNSTTTSGNTNVSESASIGSSSYSVMGKMQEKENEKKGFIKCISSLFSWMSTDSSQMHKSKSYDMSHKSNVVTCITETSSYSSGAEGERNFHFSKREKKENEEIIVNAQSQQHEEGMSCISAAEKFWVRLPSKEPGFCILVEMKAHQEKISSVFVKCAMENKTSSENLLHAVNLKSTGLANSQTEAFSKDKGISPKTGNCNISPGHKHCLPPPITPKPQPKSMLSAFEGRFSDATSQIRSMYMGSTGSVDLYSKVPSTLTPNLGPTKRSWILSTSVSETTLTTTERNTLRSGSSLMKNKLEIEQHPKTSEN